MEQEIDLRPYVQAVVRQWRLIIGVVALAAVAAGIVTLSLPRAATARGDVLIIARTPQLTLDSRFADRDATMVTNALNQRQALLDLASSPELEARVAKKLGLELYTTGELLAQVTVSGRSDLLQFETSAKTPEEASLLAETWAGSYEALINEIYSGGASLEGPLDKARQDYAQAQSDLSAFYASGDLVRIQQSVLRIDGLLSSGAGAHVNMYTQYLSRTQELNLILEDARTLQAQYEQSGSVNLGASLATLAVRARLAGDRELPVQLNFDNAEAFAASQASTADLAEFVRVLEVERDRMVAQSEALASELAVGNGTAIGLPPDVRARYEADLATAKSMLSQAESQEKRLILQRDVALRAIEVLQAKLNERQIDQAVPEVGVRFVGAAAQPPRPILLRLVANLGAAVVLSFMLVLAFIIGREVLWRRLTPRSAIRTSSERAVDTPTAFD
jgi:capsular polysaccharide biosynthesis protein